MLFRSISRYEWHRVEIAAYPNVSRWYKSIAGRPAVRRGYDQPIKVQDIPLP